MKEVHGNHIGGLLTVSWWLGHVASHNYFNYTGLINLVRSIKASCAKRTLVWLLIALYCCIPHSVLMLLNHFSNDKPAKHLVCLNGFSYSELLTRRTYHIQCVGPRSDLVRCSGTWNFPPLNLALLKYLTNTHNFILKQLLQYMEFLQCNGEGELRKFSREGWLAICRVCICK